MEPNSYLFAQSREQIAAAQKIEDQIQFAGRLERIVQPHDERMAHIGEDVALVGAAHAILHLQRGFLQHFHGVQCARVHADDFAHQKYLAKGALAQHLEQFELRRIRFVVALLDDVLQLEFALLHRHIVVVVVAIVAAVRANTDAVMDAGHGAGGSRRGCSTGRTAAMRLIVFVERIIDHHVVILGRLQGREIAGWGGKWVVEEEGDTKNGH